MYNFLREKERDCYKSIKHRINCEKSRNIGSREIDSFWEIGTEVLKRIEMNADLLLYRFVLRNYNNLNTVNFLK